LGVAVVAPPVQTNPAWQSGKVPPLCTIDKADALQYFPAGQGAQAVELVLPVPRASLPSSQSTGVTDPVGQYEPDGHVYSDGVLVFWPPGQ
jgi:hypothetical protein